MDHSLQRNDGPATLLQRAAVNLLRSLATRRFCAALDRHHRPGPIRRALHVKQPDTDIVLRRQRPSEVTDPAYRQDCYRAAGIVDRPSVASIDFDSPHSRFRKSHSIIKE